MVQLFEKIEQFIDEDKREVDFYSFVVIIAVEYRAKCFETIEK